MKKILFFLAICCLAACSNVNKEELKKEILSEIKSHNNQPTVKKGDGSNFYGEPVYIGSSGSYYNEIEIQHSTISCPAIKNGIQRNIYKLDPYHNTFCNICMNDELITTWNQRFFPNGYKK
jgi:hypothetical protein